MTSTIAALLAPELVAESFGNPAGPGEPMQLAAGRCEECGRHVFPAMAHCPVDGAPMTTVALSRTARLRGHTSVLAPPPEVELPVPYHVGTAEFSEGLIVLGLLLADPDQVTIGDDLEVVAHPVGEQLTFAFRPTGGR